MSENKNFFQVPNEYQDAKCKIRIPGRAIQVLNVIERFTLGWNKKEADISFKTFRERTGMDNRHIMRARNRLIKMNIIIVAKKGNQKKAYYRIQMDYTKWRPLPKKVTKQSLPKKTTKILAKKGNNPLPNLGTITSNAKDIHIKDILFKDRESNIQIHELKKRLEELKDDLKEEKMPGELNYIREGIKEIENRLKEAKP